MLKDYHNKMKRKKESFNSIISSINPMNKNIVIMKWKVNVYVQNTNQFRVSIKNSFLFACCCCDTTM